MTGTSGAMEGLPAKPRVAVAQMTSTADRAANLAVCEGLITQAKAE